MNYRVEIAKIYKVSEGGWRDCGVIELIDGKLVGKPKKDDKYGEKYANVIQNVLEMPILGKLGKRFDPKKDPLGFIQNLRYQYSRGVVSATPAKEI